MHHTRLVWTARARGTEEHRNTPRPGSSTSAAVDSRSGPSSATSPVPPWLMQRSAGLGASPAHAADKSVARPRGSGTSHSQPQCGTKARSVCVQPVPAPPPPRKTYSERWARQPSPRRSSPSVRVGLPRLALALRVPSLLLAVSRLLSHARYGHEVKRRASHACRT